jgi:glycerophosphoryl diester phosphodiesterase
MPFQRKGFHLNGFHIMGFQLRRVKSSGLIIMLVGMISTGAMAQSAASCLDLQGHRGARGKFPENTLPAFQYALTQGVTTLETDIVMTRDQTLMVGHDPVLNPDLVRDASGQWLNTPTPAVFGLTTEQVRQFDVGRIRPGSRMASLWPEQQAVDQTRMPLLSELFGLVARAPYRVELNIETKLSPLDPAQSPAPAAFAQAVVEALRFSGMMDRTIVQSFDWRTLVEVKRIAPGVRTACLSIDSPNFSTTKPGADGSSPWHAGLKLADHGSVPALVKAAKCDVWSMFWRNLDAPQLAQAKALGLKVVPWTVNDIADMQSLAVMGVDGLITDYPNRWVEARFSNPALRAVCRTP